MDKAITTALLIIASIAATLALINAVIPAMGRSSGALLTANNDAANRIRTDVEIVHATGDTATDRITVWVKNIGSQEIKSIESSDIFLDTPTDVQRLSYSSGAADGCDCWNYEIENGTAWTQAVTVKFTVYLTAVASGSHSVRVTVANGVGADKDFSV